MTTHIAPPDPVKFPDLSIEDVFEQIIRNDLLENDRDLFQSKWWDYRFMSPFEATMAFADAFGEAGRRIYAREFDYERAPHVSMMGSAKLKLGLERNEERARRAFPAFWRARQVADVLGMPYPVYTFEILSSRMRAWQRTHLPGPNHLYNEIDVERVAARWEEIKLSRIQYADHHAFLAQNFVSAPAQVEYADYLIERATRTLDPVVTLADMVRSDRLPLEYLSEKLPVDQIAAVRKSLM